VLPPGLRAVLLSIVVPLYQVQLIFSLLKRWKAEFFDYGVFSKFTLSYLSLLDILFCASHSIANLV